MSSRALDLREGSGDAPSFIILVASQKRRTCLLFRSRNLHKKADTFA
jgi:hypothetical protein